MGEFLLVVPQGWTQLDWNGVRDAQPELTKGNVENWISTGQLATLEDLLKGIAAIPVDKTLIEAKLIDDTYLLVVLA